MLSTKTYLKISGAIFCLVGFLHFFRLLMGWTVILAGFVIPVWISIFGVVIAWYLAYNAWVLANKDKKTKRNGR